MTSEVLFLDKRKCSLEDRTPELIAKLAKDIVRSGDSTAVKMHFGEPGNTAYLKPDFVLPVIRCLRDLGAIPFLTDANTLYKGERANSADHIRAAAKHGYTPGKMGCEIVIADGPDSRDLIDVEVGLKHFRSVSLAAAALRADSLVVLSHFKGHELTGFGGTLKNLGMGLGSRAGKQRMHSDVRPRVEGAKCVGDGECRKSCPAGAIEIKGGKAVIDKKKCIGCAACTVACPTGAIAISWDGEPDIVQEKIAEYAFGVLKTVRRAVFVNYLLEISPNCDCYPKSGEPIAKDLGILASLDPVALDQASADMVNGAEGRIAGPDKFRAVHPGVDWSRQLKHAEEIGLGLRKYGLTLIV